MRSPMARFYEHLQEIRSVKRAASYAKYLKKTLAFKNTHLGDLCVWVVAVAELPMIRALEHCFCGVAIGQQIASPQNHRHAPHRNIVEQVGVVLGDLPHDSDSERIGRLNNT